MEGDLRSHQIGDLFKRCLLVQMEMPMAPHENLSVALCQPKEITPVTKEFNQR